MEENDRSSLPIENIREMLARAQPLPGVYIMRNAEGEVIYVGKARNLRKRLASYAKPPDQADIKTAVLVKKIDDVETIVTATEKEALILESNLIKKYRPRYNVTLKDDKRYPALRLDPHHPYPRLSIVRKMKKDGALYFGPYSSAHAVRQTLKIINKTFMLRKCTEREFKTRTRPCLHCQMQACLAPCCRDVDRKVYEEMVKEVILFLKGRTPDLIKKIKGEMLAAAGDQDFERAARLRDKMFALEKTIEKQVVVSPDFKDRDVIATAKSDSMSLMMLMTVRAGFLQGSRCVTFNETFVNDEKIVEAFILQHYDKAHFIPKEILTPVDLEDKLILQERLARLKGEKVALLFPRRGEKAKLLQMAVQNAEKELAARLAAESRYADLLLRLQKRLKLAQVPLRIECFDNSNLAGTEPVSAMVVFEDAKPAKQHYRTYRIENVAGPDDYAFMDEVLRRRFGKDDASAPYPDLLVLDGGKGQLNIALAVLKELQLEGCFDLIGIAKKDSRKGETQDKIFKPFRSNPVSFGKETDLLLFLQRVRDEAHRFAVSFHRRRRRKTAVQSSLDGIPGIGPKRKEVLLKHFKSVHNLRSAGVEEIASVPGIHRQLAETIKEALLDDFQGPRQSDETPEKD